MTREDAFIADIIANPADDAVRLIYADWLDGQGREEYGEFIRLQCELARIDYCYCNPPCWDRMDYSCRSHKLQDRERELFAKAADEAMQLDEPLWNILPRWHIAGWSPNELHLVNLRSEQHSEIRAILSRGFVAEVRCTCADWLAHGPALVRRQPIERCVLVDKKPGRMWGHDTGNEASYRRWWNALHSDTGRQMDADVLPDCLFRYIVFPFKSGYHFPTESSALDALSKAAIAWAKQTEPATTSA